MKVIDVSHLIKRYKKATVNSVDDISFHVEEGEFFAFLGPNGAGKTTTISILTTRLSKTSGEVYVSGLEIDKHASQIREHIGIIFQNPSLDLNLTGEQNIRFHCILYGLYPFALSYNLMPESYKKHLQELSTLIGLGEDIFKPTKTYSGGMKRKLEIIRSLMHSPKILFLDEPTTGLDPESRRNLWDYLQQVRRDKGVTIFLTTHYLDEVEGADHVCIINKGKIVANGSPEEIKSAIAGEYIAMKAKDMQILSDELRIMGVKYENVEDTFHVFFTDSQKAQEIISNIKTPLTYLELKRVSLEDAYIKIIKDELNI